MSPHADDARDAPALDAVRTAALAFSTALDAGDLARVRQGLAPGCELVDGGESTRGADAVIEALRTVVRWSERSFDDVRPTSSVVAVSANAAEVAVTILWMRVPGRWHRLQFVRDLEFDADGRVARLRVRCDPAVGSAFSEFARASGAPPVPCGFGIPTEV